MIEILRKSDDYIIRVGIVFLMMLTTIMPVEIRWVAWDVWIIYAIPALMTFGMTVLVWKRQKMEVTLADVVAATWFLYYVGRTWIGNEWPCQMEFLKTAELFLLYVGLRIAFHGTKMSEFVLIGSILLFGCYEAWLGVSQMYGYEISRHRLFALTGNFLNPGPYSAYLMLGVVVCLVTLKGMPDKTIMSVMPQFMPIKVAECLKVITWKHLLIAAVTIMAMVLPATWSRAAFLGVAVVVIFVYRDKYWKYRYIVWESVIVATIAFYLIKQGSADGRLMIWKATLTTWIDYPWLGVGIGGFFNAFAEGMTKLSTTGADFSSVDVPDSSYNILLEIVAEQGLVGGGLAISLTAVVMMRLARNSNSLFWGMVSLLVFAMFSYPFDLLPYKVIAVLIVAWSESKGEIQKTNNQSQKTIGWIKVFLFSCFLGFASWQAGKITSKCFKIEKNLGKVCRISDSYSVEEGFEWMSSEGDNREFLFAFGKKLREEGRYNESNAVLRQGTMCSSDPIFYVLIGNNYKDMKHYDLAEESYYKAFSVMPNRLYPLYQLMLLYQESGNVIKAKAMAKRVIEMKPKIDSQATRKMKEKAQLLL